jgi:SAM-dependent methyltransferase
MPEPLAEALAGLRPILLDADGLVRAVAAGRRRNHTPAHARVELRPVDLKSGRHLQVFTTDGRTPTMRNLPPGPDAEAAVDALLAEPFGNWHVQSRDRVVQLRVTKKGEAQVHTERTEPVEAGPARHDRDRQHLLDPGDPLFGVLGADADKRRQVDAFLRQLDVVVEPAFAAARAAGRPLHVVDLGCGNAYLTFAAHRWLLGQPAAGAGVRTVGVDVRADMIERNRRLAAELAMDGLEFREGDIAGADPGLDGVDLVLALHACDTATDEALARAVRWQAPVLLAAPCCHHDVRSQLDANRASSMGSPNAALLRHPILRERLGDVLTDALRADLLRLLGYRVEVVEFIESRHTPRNVLLRARASADRRDAPARREEYREQVAAWRVEPALARLLRPELDRLPVTDSEVRR